MRKFAAYKKFYNSVDLLTAEWKRDVACGFDWSEILSPIERSLWDILRTGRVPFYPQYPVLNRFVDFGNPYLKIAIEADSKKWHDPLKDAERDEQLLKVGWITYRIPSRELLGDVPDWERLYLLQEDDAHDLARQWLLETAEGMSMALDAHYGSVSIYNCPAIETLTTDMIGLYMVMCLNRHSNKIHKFNRYDRLLSV